ncbi:MAG: DUF6268 family outer membrane beta-barrel protein [Desulfofustis sp.]
MLWPATSALAQAEPEKPLGGPPAAGWTSFARGGAVYQFDAELDNGTEFSSSRFNIEAGSGYSWTRRNSVALALSYSLDDYSFSNNSAGQTNGVNPWDDIHSLSLSLPVRWGVSERWSSFFVPSVRSSGESGAEFSDTISGGLLGGFAYRFSDSLTIGPGLGIISQLEDDATIFPILIVDWQITDKLSLETGRGLAATLGPGLTLNYQLNPKWNLAIGGRYEKLRFRLDTNAETADGIGEDRSFPLFASATHRFTPKIAASLVGGLELDGELRQEDKDGNEIGSESYDPAAFLGLTFNIRW